MYDEYDKKFGGRHSDRPENMAVAANSHEISTLPVEAHITEMLKMATAEASNIDDQLTTLRERLAYVNSVRKRCMAALDGLNGQNDVNKAQPVEDRPEGWSRYE